MIDLEEYKNYLKMIGLASNSIVFYSSHITTGLQILNSIDEFNNLNDIEKLSKLSKKDNNYKNIYDNYHNGNKDTFSDNRSVSGSYIRFLQYKKIIETLELYNENPSLFQLNGASWFFKIFNQTNEYPIKAICRYIEEDLELSNQFSTNQAKEKLNKIFRKENITFNDLNNIVDGGYYPHINTKNIILYGAPGVGKTHNYQRIISMIENGEDEKTIFNTITDNESSEVIEQNKEDFQKIKEKRVEFITFHQNYSYEDFIEGYRPSGDGNITLEDGIFKVIVNNAKENLHESRKSFKLLESESKNKNIFEKFIDELLLQEKITLTDSVHISNIDEKAFYYSSTYSNGMKNVKILFSDIQEIIMHNVQNQKDIKKLSNIMGTTKQRVNYPYIIYQMFKKFKEEHTSNNNIEIVKEVKQENFYIVIDEINRGNISKIFGELITLIEEDKRDTYEVTLPYSKSIFSIPSNLYIIATMNSTDKSIATIDIALRRRFTFLKMKPNLHLVQNNDARKLMERLNKEIKSTLGEDYMLGHSYFMGEKIDLEFIIEYRIKPLLEEYFYTEDITSTEIIKKALEN